ncbi:hypothetical protein EDC56_0247 [Sinobacterium caligoides]|uniref:Uncharacterized protein n=1 Tax=Sinobacterium caligoides TaxID=933926 RepID=A0A3N2DY89_9GAMM|nr:hypothetical protein [Sinobacterium caligoides]ROS04734.1 hypothetical protein EDC56_0247 [Sinobacterium caligoides]
MLDKAQYEHLKVALEAWDKKDLLEGVACAATVVAVDNLNDLIELTAFVESVRRAT